MREKITYLMYGGFGIIVLISIFVVWQKLRSEDKPVKPTVTALPSASIPVQNPLKIRVSIPYWDEETAFTSFQTHIDRIQSTSLFWYYMNKDGKIVTYQPVRENRTILDFAHARGKKVSAVVTNLPEEAGITWDSERVEFVLDDPARRQKHIEEIQAKLIQLTFDGVTIDYEEVDKKARQNFTDFIKDLAAALHQRGLFVGVALHPKTGEKSDLAYVFQDWGEVAKYADELYIMAYGEHWDEGHPGAIASAEWVKKIIDYSETLRVPLAKFYLGIPLYGYDWEVDSENKARGLTYVQVKELMRKFGIASEWGQDTPAPFFDYEEQGKKHEVWFENGPSVEEKIKLTQGAGFGGVTFWRLGGEDTEVWERVKKYILSPSAST